MKTLREQFEQYRVPVDESGWSALAGDPVLAKFNRGRKIRRVALYSASGMAVATAVLVTVLALTRPRTEPTANPVPTTPQVTAVSTPATPVPTATPAAPAQQTNAPVSAQKTEPNTTLLAPTSQPEPAAIPTTPPAPKTTPIQTVTPAISTPEPATTHIPEAKTQPSTPTQTLANEPNTRTEDGSGQEPQPQTTERLFFAPNAFSPNGDGVNDIFQVFTNVEYTEFELNIYSRSGDHVFQSRHMEDGWNGCRKGSNSPVPQGVYVYTIKYRTADHTSGVEKGQILLIR